MVENTSAQNSLVRISLPSKGRLAEECLALMSAAGLAVYKPNERQYEAVIPALPGVKVIFQRPGDIATSVRAGSMEFGITGLDVVEERRGENGDVLVLHDDLAFGACSLDLAVPETWSGVRCTADLRQVADGYQRPLRVATKYPVLVGRFLSGQGVPHSLISAEGTLETAPAIGYADLIADIVSSGQTLRDNRLRQLEDGRILRSQAVLIANRRALQERPEVLEIARTLLEFFEAHLRAKGNLAVFANMRGESADAIAERIFRECSTAGLQGPTISRVYVQGGDAGWYAVNVIVPRGEIFQAIRELRAIGGSGVVVLPVTYIFDEEPPRYRKMLEALQVSQA